MDLKQDDSAEYEYAKAFSIEDIAELLGTGRNQIEYMMEEEGLPFYQPRSNARKYIFYGPFKEWIKRQTEASSKFDGRDEEEESSPQIEGYAERAMSAQ